MFGRIHHILKNIIIRLIVYYVAWLLALGGIFQLFPEILVYVAEERERLSAVQRDDIGAGTLGEIKEGVETLAGGNIKEVLILVTLVDPAHTIPVMVALAMAFWVTLPITWLYRWTRSRKQYNQSFAHTLLVIPIAISLVVFLVKGSLALAFSLAGIVAAVRFRTSLEEPMDSVYMLMAIGIGLAAGTQLILVAYIASVVFVIIMLTVWKQNFGAEPEVLSGWRIADSPQLDTGGEGANYNAQIEVHTNKIDVAKKATAQILELTTKQWQEAEVIENADGTATIVFDVWLKKSVTLPAFIQDIEENGRGSINEVKLKKGG